MNILQIPEVYSFIRDPDNRTLKFLQFDSGEGVESRMLIFSTQKLLDILKEAGTIFADGTFKMAPTPFRQLYILRAEFDGVVVTVCYVMLTSKTQQQYIDMFRQLQIMCPGLEMSSLMIDFELAVRYVVCFYV